MYNCIFTSHCLETFCDRSCPILAETSYLLERNNISMDSFVFHADPSDIKSMVDTIKACDQSTGAYVASGSLNTVQAAELMTYCAICYNWQGNQLHCNVYNLKFSKYLDDLKKSWSLKSEPESLEYMRIWSESSKVLIISNFDYVNFGDFESQTLLNLLQSRQSNRLTTILVTPPIKLLVSSKSSPFFNSLKSKLYDAVKVVSQK